MAVYYSQLQASELVAGVARLFQQMAGNVHGDQNLTLIKKNYKERYREIYVFQFENEIYYVKRFYPLTLREKLKYWQFSPRGIKCLTLSRLLLRAGFSVPEPMFVLTYQRRLFRWESIFVARKFDGISLGEFVTSNVETTIKNEVMYKFAQTLGRFYSKGFIQTDPNFGNFLMDRSGKNTTFTFVDIDAIIYKPYFGSKDVYKSIAKCFAFLCCSLAMNNKANIFSPEKLFFFIHTILHAYNPQVKVEKMAALIRQRIKFNLKRWNRQDYLALFD